jgi:Holliday junction resolvase RusA-like endonuclease
MNEFTFFVHGMPAPGGSKNVFPMWDRQGELVCKTLPSGKKMPVLRVVDDAGDRNKQWRLCVQNYAKAHRGANFQLWTCPVKSEFIFYLPRPQCHFRTGKFSHELRDDAPAFHTQKPDALKLARSTEDALTEVLWKDDSQNVVTRAEKRWCGTTDKVGCAVRIILLSEAARPKPVPVQPELPVIVKDDFRIMVWQGVKAVVRLGAFGGYERVRNATPEDLRNYPSI